MPCSNWAFAATFTSTLTELPSFLTLKTGMPVGSMAEKRNENGKLGHHLPTTWPVFKSNDVPVNGSLIRPPFTWPAAIGVPTTGALLPTAKIDPSVLVATQMSRPPHTADVARPGMHSLVGHAGTNFLVSAILPAIIETVARGAREGAKAAAVARHRAKAKPARENAGGGARHAPAPRDVPRARGARVESRDLAGPRGRVCSRFGRVPSPLLCRQTGSRAPHMRGGALGVRFADLSPQRGGRARALAQPTSLHRSERTWDPDACRQTG